jgi:arabinogalactan oligomer / maltooligosaccharide transport system permease protein
MMYRLAGFTGVKAQIAKIAAMSIVDALLIWMFFASIAKPDSSTLTSVIAVIFAITNIIYFAKFTLPFKFLLPGLILLVTFVVVPVIYTVQMSGYQYKTGNEISKSDALVQIKANGLALDDTAPTYDMTLGKVGGKIAALLTSQMDQSVSLATDIEVLPLAEGTFTRDQNGIARAATGFAPVTADYAANHEEEIINLKFPLGSGKFVAPQGIDVAAVLTQSLQYDSKTDTFKSLVDGTIYKDNNRGNYADTKDASRTLTPGWRAWNAFENYTHLFTDANVRGPFIGVFAWTISFAVISVLMMFAVGLLLAVILNQKIALRRFYRSILILPYAIPSFMSILIWNGMFNRQFGAINALFHTQIDFFNSPWLAKGVILIVNLWLGFPYFYLISSGALQSIPSELEEAASIDGANNRQIMGKIKLPLILQILSPLLIASFAFNFNNFNIVYLLTGGGPTDVLHGKTAGATDILITYTYKTAFGSQEQNLGLACAISMVIFLIVGSLSLWSLRRSKVLETL